VVSVALVILDVLVVALILELIVLGLLRLVRMARRSSVPRERIGASVPSSTGATGFGAATAARKRRCNNCRSGWIGEPGTDASVLVLRRRRRARRAARRRGTPVPAWAVKQGWNRCPSCFSRDVRDSRSQQSDSRTG
jgi:Tfp pilus assembly protein PilV